MNMTKLNGQIQGLLSNPLLAFGAGMLDSRGTYGKFGPALMNGLLSASAMTSANLNQNRMKQANEAFQKQQEDLEKYKQNLEKMQKLGLQVIGNPAQQVTAPTGGFTGQTAHAGIMPGQTGTLPATNMYAQNPQMARLLSAQIQADPMGGIQGLLSNMQPPEPTSAMLKYKEQIALGADPKAAMGNAYGHPPAATINNTVGGAAQPAVKLTPEQKAYYGIGPTQEAVFDDKGMPKPLTTADDAEKRKKWEQLSAAGNAATEYQKKLEKYGTEQWPSSGKLELGSAYAEMLFQAKELANLGALQGPDLELMERVLIDPTSWKNIAYSGSDAVAQLKVFQDKIDAAWVRAIQMYGLPPGSQRIK